MPIRDPRTTPLADIHLGDIIVLPDARDLTVRGQVTLYPPVHEMAGFVICGELTALLSTPPEPDGPYAVYDPLDYMPYPEHQLRQVAAGAFRYWPPHQPSLSGAMAELLYRVFEVRGRIDPVVVVYRGPEFTVFTRSAQLSADALKVLAMRRDVDNEVEVDRYAAVVDSPGYISTPVTPVRSSLFEQFVR